MPASTDDQKRIDLLRSKMAFAVADQLEKTQLFKLGGAHTADSSEPDKLAEDASSEADFWIGQVAHFSSLRVNYREACSEHKAA